MPDPLAERVWRWEYAARVDSLEVSKWLFKETYLLEPIQTLSGRELHCPFPLDPVER